jgi:hypothetical protein
MKGGGMTLKKKGAFISAAEPVHKPFDDKANIIVVGASQQHYT